MARLNLITEERRGRPGFDTAISHALMRRVAAGELGPTFRLRRAEPVLAFSKQDANSPGFARAVAAAREHGFAPVLRLAGGRAAVFHEGTLACAHATPEAKPTEGTRRRFEQTGEMIVAALTGLGVDARVGEVPGEYCPGAFSINARGEVKLAGLGQRMIRGAAHMGGVVVAVGSERIRDVLVPVYEALELEWDPGTAAAIEDEVPGVGLAEVRAAIIEELGRRHELVETPLDGETLALAETFAEQHAI
jgi:octanoyl-[GcvH]:protein N-octanoyltransferase